MQEQGSLSYYFNEINKYKPLCREEEIKIGKRIKKGDRSAINEMISHNLKYVVSIAKEFRNKGADYEELINEGNIGLIKAAEKFDYKKDTKFITYAKWWIILYMTTLIRERQNESRMIDENDDGCKVAFSYGDDADFSPLKHQYDLELKEQHKSVIDKLIVVLDDREKNIILNYFGFNGDVNNTLDDLSEAYGISNERIRQIKNKAIKKMRMHYLLNYEELKDNVINL